MNQNPSYARRIAPVPFDPSLLPNGSRSLTSISLQSFCLGFILAFCLMVAGLWIAIAFPGWQLPAFAACLCVFHFLEFYITAKYNLPAVRASSFLLFNNGTAYNVAHTCAMMEILWWSYVMPEHRIWFWFGYHPPPPAAIFGLTYGALFGLCLVGLGQTVRSVAMAQAGTNFNHTPVQHRKEGHVLVTKGVYAWSRHPSYFGFFWWALGTQLLVGNKVCLLGYAAALWRFFYVRIQAEERTLTEFFGDDYRQYRKRVGVHIPFIR
ncbi:hypothetical protein BAUCODRAFT_102980 [Baudoinia panamericana UAMH 10762]|uniref:Protein-S-isoprenylcysteine O-methyltransferase n=1 Tax=Baudoinia panamericana (strain UAMH 10762) TaxID=717646 RepID=M2LVG0_BAUPA|nr:uncharacterized protein BAUCODRAFT_102980 [Baudoinia panamericana UAMH 10762]EMC98622.1 hypothetical protein BAUCODRAFT_102980 [Baudoinia panamericana UAMH 10762]